MDGSWRQSERFKKVLEPCKMYELISGFGMALSLATCILVAISVVDFLFYSTVRCSLWQKSRGFSPNVPITLGSTPSREVPSKVQHTTKGAKT
jgi:hypothetical protein